jgi:drug/metabolite transporter (DMT)-like permease
VKHLGPGRTANFNNLVPVLAFIFSYFTLHEQLLPIQFVGAGVTVVGIWIARR